MKYIIWSLLGLSFWSCQDNTGYPNHVGDIEKDSHLDSKDFKPCTDGQVYQYYNFGNNIQYKGEKRALINTFKREFKNQSADINGYVTIRFIVNCMGETGRFRVKTLDGDYKPIDMNKSLVDQLLSITKNLDGWLPGASGDLHYDYYQYLTFKITEGQIKSILP